MREFWHSLIKFFTSLKLTVTLLALSIVLVFFATLDQVHLGVWGVQHKWFRSLLVFHPIGDVYVPVFPGGYVIGGLLFINLVSAYYARFKFTWKKAGILISHAGLVLLLVGELLSGLLQRDHQMRLDVGQTKSYTESPRHAELTIIDATGPEWDHVVAVPEARLKAGAALQHPALPFTVNVLNYMPNSVVQMADQAPAASASGATQGIGARLAVTPAPITYDDSQRNLAAALIELKGPEGALGRWLVSTWLAAPQTFDYAGRTWRLSLRFERDYQPYSLKLLKFTHDKYPGTEIPKDFSSHVLIDNPQTGEAREVRIYMNNPLRYAGLTYYQSGFDNNDTTTVLQVVRNPGWLLPYIACALLTLGLVVQFGIGLTAFARKRAALRKAA